MRSNLPKFDYDFKQMELQELYFNENYKIQEEVVKCPSIKKVYKRSLAFSKSPEERPLIYSSLVTSIDGKIAFSDAPEGPFIASKNKLDENGATVDWWTLNLLRASADAILFGANTLKSEAEGTGHVYDQELEDERLSKKLPPVPFNVIPTIDGQDIPYKHKEFVCGEVPIIIYTTEKGAKVVEERIEKPTVVLNAKELVALELDCHQIYILIADDGKGGINNLLAMQALRKMGIKRLLVESPTVLHLLIQEEMVDELFMNMSCVYIGGDALSIGKKGVEFTSENHPHTELISLYMHSPSFFYLRHKFVYDE